MTTPGVETRPIKLISGECPFCETFFTDVKVPKENLVGQLNGGWEIAKRLLQYERQNISGGFGGGGGAGGAAGDLGEIAKTYVGADETGAVADPDLRGAHHPQQDGLPGLRPDHRPRRGRSRGPATAPRRRPRSSNTPPPPSPRSARS